MKNIRNIIFDFGGVLVDLDKQRALEGFANIGFDAKPYIGTYSHGGPFQAAENGDITPEEFLHQLPGNGTDEQKRQAWNSFLVDVPRRRRQAILRLHRKYATHLLSNTNAIHWQDSLNRWWRAEGHTEHDYFGHIFLSYELHQCKPGTDIFHTAIATTGVRPDETLYIDDSQANCEAAASTGLQTLCATGDEWMGCVATIGHFDGVHQGHRYLIDRVKSLAEERNMWSMLITFDRHPRSIVQPDKIPPMLTTAEQKLQLLYDTDVDQVEVLHFDQQMAQMSARDFLQYIKKELGVRILLVGHDHHFGHSSQAETVDDYRRYGFETGVEVIAVEAMPGAHVSSSQVRRCLAAGDVEGAAALLGRHYSLEGPVVQGNMIGRTIDFPTANIDTGSLMLPACGVYHAQCTTEGNDRQGTIYPAVVNIGHRPTIDDGPLSVEVHIPGYNGNLYGQRLNVQLLRFMRPERHFDSLDLLKEQIQKDVKSLYDK